MKNIIFTIIALFSSILLSCSSTQSIAIKGEPGYEIYSPDMEKLGEIDNTGNANITISRDGYYAYLLSHKPGSGQLVPFALDYKHKNHYGAFFALNTCYAFCVIGLTADIASLAILASGDDSGIGGVLMASGLGMALPSVFLGMNTQSYTDQTQYQHKFEYLSTQNSNSDINFLPIQGLETGNAERKK